MPGTGGTGAGNESRTRDLNLGKVALYQLSYSRSGKVRNYRDWFGHVNRKDTPGVSDVSAWRVL